MIYLDYSATTPVDERVLDSYCKVTREFIGNANSIHTLGVKSKELLMQAKYPYSQLYFNLARNERDMGVKKFHSIIERALLKINYENA